MKRFNQWTNASLVFTVLVVILGLFGLSTVFAASGRQVNLLAPKVDIAATAKALQIKNRENDLDDELGKRIRAIQTEVDQVSRSLREFENMAATQTTQQNEQLSALQQQLLEKRATVQSVESVILQHRQNLIKDEEDHNNDMAALNQEMGTQVTELSSQLATVNNEISNLKIELTRAGLSTPEIPDVRLSREDSLPARISSGSGESSGNGSSVSGKPDSGGSSDGGGDSSGGDSSDSHDNHSDDSEEDE